MSTNLFLIVAIILVSLYAWQRPALQQKMMMNPYQIYHHKQYYRFVSSGFIHSGYLHLFFNCFTLFFFGDSVDREIARIMDGTGVLVLGPDISFNVFYLLFFLLAVVISDIPTFVKHRDKIYYNSLGASGGVSAVIFAAILFFPLAALSFVLIPVRIPGFLLGTLFLIYSYYQSKGSLDNVNHDAHLYGALFGIVACTILEPSAVMGFFQQLATFDIIAWQWTY